MAPIHQGLTLRKRADHDAPVNEDGTRPLLGISLDHDPREHAGIPTSTLDRGISEGWMSLENETIVMRPGGPADDPWRVRHVFRQGSVIVLHTLDGDVRYAITKNADKYHADGSVCDEAGDPDSYVNWFYECELEA